MCVCVRLEDGRLLDYLVAHDELMEEKVAFFIRETLEALQHLHTCRVAHLDLKVRPMKQIQPPVGYGSNGDLTSVVNL